MSELLLLLLLLHKLLLLLGCYLLLDWYLAPSTALKESPRGPERLGCRCGGLHLRLLKLGRQSLWRHAKLLVELLLFNGCFELTGCELLLLLIVAKAWSTFLNHRTSATPLHFQVVRLDIHHSNETRRCREVLVSPATELTLLLQNKRIKQLLLLLWDELRISRRRWRIWAGKEGVGRLMMHCCSSHLLIDKLRLR